MKLPKELTDFLWSNCIYLYDENKKEDLLREVERDLKHNRIVYTTDEQGLTGVCRFSILGNSTRILDVAVRQDKRGSGVLQDLLRFGLNLYPNVKTLMFNSITKKREFTIPVSLILAKEK